MDGWTYVQQGEGEREGTDCNPTCVGRSTPRRNDKCAASQKLHAHLRDSLLMKLMDCSGTRRLTITGS